MRNFIFSVLLAINSHMEIIIFKYLVWNLSNCFVFFFNLKCRHTINLWSGGKQKKKKGDGNLFIFLGWRMINFGFVLLWFGIYLASKEKMREIVIAGWGVVLSFKEWIIIWNKGNWNVKMAILWDTVIRSGQMEVFGLKREIEAWYKMIRFDIVVYWVRFMGLSDRI